MKKITFDEEELLAVAVFEPDSRKNTADRMEAALPHLEEDREMHALLLRALEKLKRITDSEFEALELEEYREEIAYSDDEEEEDNPGEDGTEEGLPDIHEDREDHK